MLESSIFKRFRMRALVSASLLSLLAGCAVGPDFVAPSRLSSQPLQERFARAPAVPANLPGGAQEPSFEAEFDIRDPAFWMQFKDPVLSQLMAEALASNLDLRGAWARVQAADALLRQSDLDRFPIVTMSADASQQKLGRDQLSPGQPRASRSYSAGVQASWEIDLFGRVRRNIEAQSAQTEAVRADVLALQIVIAAQVADGYAQLRGLQLRLQLAERNARNQGDTLRLVERRFASGMGTALDTSRSEAQLRSTQSRIPGLEAQIAVNQHRLAVLVGRSPASLIELLSAPAELPQALALLDPGTPAQLLRRRPDIAAAEARLHAATAHIGVASADLFPRLSLGGLLGSWALGGHDLFKGASASSKVFLGVDWSFLDVGRVRARIAASEAGAQEALVQYQQTVLVALEDTENALVRVSRNADETESLQLAAKQRDEAERLAQRMYRAGSLSLYEVLDAQREQLVVQDALAISRIDGVRASIGLYKALAGGWPRAEAKETGPG